MINSHVNKIILVGQVETPRLPTRLNSKQSLVTNFELKTQLQIRTGNGFVVEETCIHSVTAWGDLARLCIKNLRVGSLIYLEGRLCWGNGSERRKFGESGNKPWIVAEQIRLLNMTSESEGESETEGENETKSASEEASDEDDTEDGVLFSSHPLTASNHN
ncbi:MAG TPA: single-stranded DNA-binding protein [Chloroflexia bacterium]|nr:single-stranded DNA-binding protein [Chloroflexia bacterium]